MRLLICLVVFVAAVNGQEAPGPDHPQPHQEHARYPAVSSCPSLRLGPGATVRPPSCAGPASSGTVCHFSCPRGYRVNGSMISVCRDDGSWLYGRRDVTCVDRNECRFRKGHCSHKCVNTEGSYRCECPKPLVLGKDGHNCRAVGLVLNCTDHNIEIIIPKYALSDLQGDHLQLRDPSCHARENATHYIFKTELNGCGTKRRHARNFLVYSNKVQERPFTPNGLITRIGDGEFNIPFCCYYLDNGIVSSVGYKPYAKELVIKEKGYGRFKLRMDFFHSQSYLNTYSWGDFPVSVFLRDRLYFEVSIDSHDPNLVIFASECFSTPTRDHTKAGRFRHDIIHNGCFVDTTARIEPSTSGHKQRFSVEAFKFLGKFPFVYLHCDVMVCKADNHHSRCSRGCLNHHGNYKPGHHHHDEPSIAKKDHVVREPSNEKHEKAAGTVRSTRAVDSHHAKGSDRQYSLSKGPVSLIEDEPAIQRFQVPAAAVKRVSVLKDVARDESQGKDSAEPQSKRRKAANKGVNQGARTTTNVLLVVLTACTLFALVGILYLNRKMKKDSKRGLPGNEPMKF